MYLNQCKQGSPIIGEKQPCGSAGKPWGGRPRVIHQAGHSKAIQILKCLFLSNAIPSMVNRTANSNNFKSAQGGSKREIIINTQV